MYLPFHPPKILDRKYYVFTLSIGRKKDKYKKISRKILRISLFEEGDAPEGWTPIKDK